MTACLDQKNSSEMAENEFRQYLDTKIPSLMQRYDIPGVSVALIQDGKILWTKAYGYANLESKTPMTTGTPCRVESISKSVTAWGVLRLVQSGEIHLDTPVFHYLKSWKFPESSYSDEKITVRHLLSQQSGLPLGTIGVRYSPVEPKPSLREYLSDNAVLFQEPGISFFYSNTGFNLLELLIEEVSGQDFAIYMKQEVLLPLGMEHSDFSLSEELIPIIPNGYTMTQDPVPVYVYPDKAAGGLFATVTDVTEFVTAGMTKFNTKGSNVLDSHWIDSLYTAEIPMSGYYSMVFDDYGLGHFIETLPDGAKSVSHGGQGTGWMTHFQSIPETGEGIVIITNSQRSWPFIGQLLTTWAQWYGHKSVGMTTIVRANRAIQIVIITFFILLIWHLIRWVNGIRKSERIAAFSRRRFSVIQGFQVLGATILTGAIWWMMSQEYFFLFSVFPKTSYWFLAILALMAVTFLLFALFPVATIRQRIPSANSSNYHE
jgi:CubicO group peptidase (beta-lactamase class C family)